MRGDTRIIAINHDCSYLDLVDRVLSRLSINSPFMIKCQPPEGSLRYLITIANDEDLANVFEEQECLNASTRPTNRLHLIVLLMPPNAPSKTTSKVMSGL